MSSFFTSDIKKLAPKKRTLKPAKHSGPKSKIPSKTKHPSKKDYANNAELDSDIDSANDSGHDEEYESDNSETTQEKKLRLTKQYLAQLEEEEKLNNESREVDEHDAISNRLQRDLREQSSKFQKQIANKLSSPLPSDIRVLRGHQLPITCLCVSTDDKFVFTGSKDCSVIKWDVESGKKVGKISATKDKTSTGCILAISISSDGKFLATGGREKVIHIYDPHTLNLVHFFIGHKNAVTGLAFRIGTHQLFSGSLDKTVKLWNLDEMAYIETLYGHQDGVTGIDSMSWDRAVTTGGRDRTLRMWKVIEEMQLVINVNGGSVDCVQMINEECMITGADDGSICLWSCTKKKPLCTLNNAHGKTTDSNDDNKPVEAWITAVTAVKSSNLVASGSCDSCIRLWRCGQGYRTLNPLFTIPMVGFVNSLAFSSDGSILFAGVGQEHRLGRWWRFKEAKNALYIIPLQKSTED